MNENIPKMGTHRPFLLFGVSLLAFATEGFPPDTEIIPIFVAKVNEAPRVYLAHFPKFTYLLSNQGKI